jgi:hypothetical protein
LRISAAALFMFLLIISCREGVIEPGTFVENVNDPVQINERNSYTFLLNANSFSMDLDVYPLINSSRARINVTLVDYIDGYTRVTVKDYDNRERYSYFAAEEISFHTDLIDGYVPKMVNIRTENFSGKIKIEIRKTL